MGKETHTCRVTFIVYGYGGNRFAAFRGAIKTLAVLCLQAFNDEYPPTCPRGSVTWIMGGHKMRVLHLKAKDK